MVPEAGIEPARPLSRGILSPLCLPVSPPGQVVFDDGVDCTVCPTKMGIEFTINMEASAGVEPAYMDLQSSA